VWNYDIDRNTFPAAPPLPERRAGGGLALFGRHLHYIGGLMPDRLTDAADHWVLDLHENSMGTATWNNAAPMPTPRNQFGTVNIAGNIYVIGVQFGHDKGQDDQARVDIYDTGTDSWSRGPELPGPHSHAEGSTFLSNGRIFITGGMTRDDRRRIDSHIIAGIPGGVWQIVGELPRPLSSPAAAIIGDRLFVAGGSLNGADPQPGMWVRSIP
jgi:N-acetylneuraminic acid mutarotase